MKILLINENDEVIGKNKLEAHKIGLLHRVFSIFVFNKKKDSYTKKKLKKDYKI